MTSRNEDVGRSAPSIDIETEWDEAEMSETSHSAVLRLDREREDAQGVEVYQDPGATIPVVELVEGTPGEESLVRLDDGIDETEPVT